MKKRQKQNLIKAFEELGAPDKETLLQKIESKKAFGGDFVESQKQIAKNAKRKKRVAWTSFACSFAVIVIAVVLISLSIFGAHSPSDNDTPNTGTNLADYRSSWNFQLDDSVSFGEIDKNIKDMDIDLIYEYLEDWTIVKTQVTQDESAYREYYSKDGVTIEVTVLLKQNLTSLDSRYPDILTHIYDSVVKDNYVVYQSIYTVNKVKRQAHIIFLEDQVYIFTSNY